MVLFFQVLLCRWQVTAFYKNLFALTIKISQWLACHRQSNRTGDTSTVMPSFSCTSEPQTCFSFTTLTLFSFSHWTTKETIFEKGKITIVRTIDQPKTQFKDGRQKKMKKIFTWKFAHYIGCCCVTSAGLPNCGLQKNMSAFLRHYMQNVSSLGSGIWIHFLAEILT